MFKEITIDGKFTGYINLMYVASVSCNLILKELTIKHIGGGSTDFKSDNVESLLDAYEDIKEVIDEPMVSFMPGVNNFPQGC